MRTKAILLLIMLCAIVFGQNTNTTDMSKLVGSWISASTGNAFEIQLTNDGFKYNNKKDTSSVAYFKKNKNEVFECYTTTGSLFSTAFIGSTVSMNKNVLLLINNDTKRSYNLVKADSYASSQYRRNYAYVYIPDTSYLKRDKEFGIHAGATTGIGFSYRYWPTKIGIQATALPVKTEAETYINLGVTGLYRVYHSFNMRIFWYLGNNVLISNTDSPDNVFFNINSSGQPSTKKRTTKYNVGFGPGVEFGTRVRFNIMAGYGFYDVFKKLYIYPTGEIGLYFMY